LPFSGSFLPPEGRERHSGSRFFHCIGNSRKSNPLSGMELGHEIEAAKPIWNPWGNPPNKKAGGIKNLLEIWRIFLYSEEVLFHGIRRCRNCRLESEMLLSLPVFYCARQGASLPGGSSGG